MAVMDIETSDYHTTITIATDFGGDVRVKVLTKDLLGILKYANGGRLEAEQLDEE